MVRKNSKIKVDNNGLISVHDVEVADILIENLIKQTETVLNVFFTLHCNKIQILIN